MKLMLLDLSRIIHLVSGMYYNYSHVRPSDLMNWCHEIFQVNWAINNITRESRRYRMIHDSSCFWYVPYYQQIFRAPLHSDKIWNVLHVLPYATI